MPRYKSISEFRHTCVIQGKKFLINPGDVVESPTQLNYIFLQQVDDSVAITNKTPFSGTRLQQQINTIAQEKDAIAQQKVAEVNETLGNVSGLAEQLKQKIEQLNDKIDAAIQDVVDQMNKHFEDIEVEAGKNKKEDQIFRETTNRRLNILKDAVRSMEEEVFGPTEETPPKNS